MTTASKKISAMRTVLTFFSGRACSDTIFHVLNLAHESPMPAEESAMLPFAGGIKQHGYQCGMIWGAALSAGAQAHRKFGPGSRAEAVAIQAAAKLVDAFRAHNKSIDCYDITNTDKNSSTMQMIGYFLVKGGTISCTRRAVKYAPLALKQINSALAEDPANLPAPPLSCTALLAEKTGMSNLHKSMVAGFAGGIGLCGSACGALGAAVWLLGMKSQADNSEAKNLWDNDTFNQKFEALVERFLKSSDYEFECSEIVGRKFESISDHAQYLQKGGCEKIITALAQL